MLVFRACGGVLHSARCGALAQVYEMITNKRSNTVVTVCIHIYIYMHVWILMHLQRLATHILCTGGRQRVRTSKEARV